MTDPRPARSLPPGYGEPPEVATARHALERAQAELHAHLRDGAPERVVDAARYRVMRAHDLLEQRWHDAATSQAV